ncbi:MAG TPA: SMI1/KNR4 family protein [Planctomycetaceae bacterium]|nr:SMI1/KNR4 family protein [Planctomycetaceae bacterium]
MVDFERFWAAGVPDGDPDDEFDDFEEPEIRPGVDAEAIREWEEEHGVTLPALLRTALAIQNGGDVRNARLQILPLEEIVPIDEDFWEWTELDESEAPDQDLMFVFGEETEVGGTYLLNFNAKGPAGEPSVYLDFHGESTYRMADSLQDLLNQLLASSAAPSVDWSEIEDLPVLARETIDISPIHRGKPASVDQVLVRDGGDALVLFTRERSPQGETLTRTRLPLPLDSNWAQIDPHRPAPIGTFGLHLHPEESDEIVSQESHTDADGRWKNTTDHGVPIYVMFESTNRDKLVSLRKQLLGDKAAANAQAKQDRQGELQRTLDALSPAERMSAMLQSALQMKAELDRECEDEGITAAGMPPELAQAAEAMQRKMQELMQRAQEKIAEHPPSPEVQQKIADILRDLGSRGS